MDCVAFRCGLNDIKSCFLHMQPWQHPGTFRRQLLQLIDSIKESAGSHCAVVIPGVPLEHAPRFANVWPLSAMVSGVAGLWEAQKRRLALTLAPSEQVALLLPKIEYGSGSR